MSEQFQFRFGTPDRPETALEAAFWEFHRANPQVYDHFDRFTHQVIRRGHENFSADAVLHRIRWETSVETTDVIFKLNNNYSAYYGRLWMRRNPEHEGFFRTRRTHGVSAALASEADAA